MNAQEGSTMKALNQQENLKYQLATLSNYEPDDIDSPEFDVAYEDKDGSEGFATVCCIELAKQALERIKELESAAESAGDSNTSAFGDGWYDGFLEAQKIINDGGCLDDITEEEAREMSEHAESDYDDSKNKKLIQ
jgi:hypothetical protein